MAIADHLIFTAYGFWLPNDPRGSWSDFVRRWELVKFGKPVEVHTRRSLTHAEHDRELRLKAKEKLRYPPVRFNGQQALTISKGFRRAIEESRYEIYACSIMHDHVHVVARRHKNAPKRIAGHLKGRASNALLQAGQHPFAGELDSKGELVSPWTRNSWDVYLDTAEDVWRAIKYVANNPVKEGFREQHWSFVEKFVG